NAIQAVPSACSSVPPPGSEALRSKTPILSIPRKPPSKTFAPVRSLRLTHQVKFISSFWKHASRNERSPRPVCSFLLTERYHAAQACTGGLTSEKFHS